MRLAAVQFRPPKAAPDVARTRLTALVSEALGEGASLVVTPEMSTTGYVFQSRQEVMRLAEPAEGPTYEAIAPLAREHGAWIVVGFAERDGDRLFNSAMVVGPDGTLAGVYRKVLLYDLDRTWAEPGTTRLLLETELGDMVPGICMDLNDNGFVRFISDRSPAIVAFCTNWLDQSTDIVPYWRVRLGDWRGWFVAANTWGVDDGVPFRGRSAILAPDGSIAAMGPASGDVVLVADGDRSP